jgi:hypothetical protein
VDRRGHEIWRQQFPEALALNCPEYNDPPAPLTVLRRVREPLGVAVISGTGGGPAVLRLLEPRDGNVMWSRPGAWQAPIGAQGPLRYVWTQAIAWPGERAPVLAAALFDGSWYSSCVQFISSDNRLLGTYYHPGNVWCSGVFDLDGDGREAVLLRGDNSSARFLRDLVPFETRSHCGFVLLLEPPDVAGQAFPYSRGIPADRDWPGVEDARERSYLLIPPVTTDAEATVSHLKVFRGDDGRYTMEAETLDRRFFRLDWELRPRACYVAVGGAAERALSGRTSVPVVYIQRGHRSLLDVPLSF